MSLVPPPGIDLHADKGPRVMSSGIALIILPTVFVTVRFVSRIIARAGFWWDDLLVVVSLILSYGPNTAMMICMYFHARRNSYCFHNSLVSSRASDVYRSGAIQWLWEASLGIAGPKTQHEPILEDTLSLHHLLLRCGGVNQNLLVNLSLIAHINSLCNADGDPTSSLTFYRRVFPVTEIRLWLYVGYGLIGSYAVATLCSTTFQW